MSHHPPRRQFSNIQSRPSKKGLRWRARVKVAGRVLVGSFCESQAEAHAEACRLKESGEKVPRSPIGVFDALEAVIDDARDRGLKDYTINHALRGPIRGMQDFWDRDTPLAAIDVGEVCWMIRESLESGRSPNTIRTHDLPLLRRAFRLAGIESPVEDAKTRMRGALKPRPFLRQVLRPQDVSRIVSKILSKQGTCPRARWVADVVLLLASTGIRSGEFCRMRIRDATIHDTGAEIGIPRPKDRSNPRTVPVPTSIVPSLKRLISEAKGDLVCGMTMEQLSTVWIRWRKRIGEPVLDGRSLRHSYATSLHRSGTPIGIVQMALGHRNLRTTSRYVHGASHDVAPYADALGLALLGSAESNPEPNPKRPNSPPDESRASEARPQDPPSSDDPSGRRKHPHPGASLGGSQ